MAGGTDLNTLPPEGEELIERVSRIGGIVLGVTENRNWIELFYEGDHTHIKSVELPGDIPLFDVFVEAIPHKATVYEHPRIMIYLAGPCDLEIVRDGNKIIIRGCAATGTKGSKNRLARRATKPLK
jgi:hypothetical protein